MNNGPAAEKLSIQSATETHMIIAMPSGHRRMTMHSARYTRPFDDERRRKSDSEETVILTSSYLASGGQGWPRDTRREPEEGLERGISRYAFRLDVLARFSRLHGPGASFAKHWGLANSH